MTTTPTDAQRLADIMAAVNDRYEGIDYPDARTLCRVIEEQSALIDRQNAVVEAARQVLNDHGLDPDEIQALAGHRVPLEY